MLIRQLFDSEFFSLSQQGLVVVPTSYCFSENWRISTQLLDLT